MVERLYRSTKHPKLPDTFARLRAQAGEPKTINTVQNWIDQTTPALSPTTPPAKQVYGQSRKPFPLPPPSHSTRQLRSSGLTSRAVNVLPLQPTHGNQRAPLPRSSQKRKMPGDSDTIPRQSARIKKIARSTSAEDEPTVKGKEKEDIAMKAPQIQQKPTSKVKEDATFDVVGNILEDERPSGFGKSRPGGGRLARGMELSNKSASGEVAVRLTTALSTPSKRSSSRSKKSGSPSKSLVIVDKRERMKFMIPRFTFRTLIDTNKSGNLKGKLQKLWQHINWHERKIIPSDFKMELQNQFDTPNKTKPLIPNDCFGAPRDKYATDDYALMRLTISDVLSSADEYRHSGCTEAHWVSIVVSPLLNLVRRLKRYQRMDSKLAVLDMTSVEISPSTLCPTSLDSVFKDLDKRIDGAIGLNLPFEKREILETGVYSEGIPSINQTASFVNFVPMFGNVEVKRPNTDRDPLIQLGTWIAAEFTKRKREGYSLDMPVLAIEIEGDAWNLHMAFAPEDAESGTYECKFVGPIEMGSTKSLLGVYQILDRLCRCADWGIGEYQTWFNEQVLAKYGK